MRREEPGVEAAVDVARGDERSPTGDVGRGLEEPMPMSAHARAVRAASRAETRAWAALVAAAWNGVADGLGWEISWREKGAKNGWVEPCYLDQPLPVPHPP
jgi:hypothetical protein